MANIIHYAIEIDTQSGITNTGLNIRSGFICLVTDLPGYDGIAISPMGDNVCIAISPEYFLTLEESNAGGTLYGSSNGIFKTADTRMSKGQRFIYVGQEDFSDGALETAKGSAREKWDIYEIASDTVGGTTISYVGKNIWYEGLISKGGLSSCSRQVDLEGIGDYGTFQGLSFSINNATNTATDTAQWISWNNLGINFVGKPVRLYCIINNVFYQIFRGKIDTPSIDELNIRFSCSGEFNNIHKTLPREVDSTGATIPICIGDIEYAKIKIPNVPVEYRDVFSQGAGESEKREKVAYGAFGGNQTYLHVGDLNIAQDEFKDLYITVISGINLGCGAPDIGMAVKITRNSAPVNIFGNNYIVIFTDTGLGNLNDSFTYPAETPGTPQDRINKMPTYNSTNGTVIQKDSWLFKIFGIETTGKVSNSVITEFKESKLYNYSNGVYVDIAQYVLSSSISLSTISLSTPRIGLDGSLSYTKRIPISIDRCSFFDSYNMETLPEIPAGASENYSGFDRLIDFDKTTSISSTPLAGIVGDARQFSYRINVDFPESEIGSQDLYFGIDFKVTKSAGVDMVYNAPVIIGISPINHHGNALVPPEMLFSTDEDVPINKYYTLNRNYYYDNVSGCSVGGGLYEYCRGAWKISDNIFNRIKSGDVKKANILIDLGTYALWVGYLNGVDGRLPRIDLIQFGLFTENNFSLSNDSFYTRVSGEKIESVNANSVYKALRLMLETYDGIDPAMIDYGNLPTTRDGWLVGKQLTETKNTADYILELCQQSFVCAFQGRKSKISFSAWKERTTETGWTHDNTNIIKDSFTNYEPTIPERIFNSISANFSYDPGSSGYFSNHRLTGVDSATPPATLTDPDLIAYWNVCRAAYLKWGIVKQFDIDLSWFNDRNRWYNSTDTKDFGTGPSAKLFMQNAAFQLTRQKRKIEYDIPITASNVLIELCDPVNFRDPVYTNSTVYPTYQRGAVHLIGYNFDTDTIHVGVTLDPLDTIDEQFGDIIETGSAPDTITESGSNTNTISEGV
jgi:hypothetical protein